MKIINSDYVVTPGRIAAKISETALREKIIQEASQYDIYPTAYIWEGDELVEITWTTENIKKYPEKYLEACISAFFNNEEDTDSLLASYFRQQGSVYYSELAQDMEIENFLYCPGAGMDEAEIADVVGFHTIGNLTFCGFSLKDEDSDSFVMIIYSDGDKLHLYTPRRGNRVKVAPDDKLYAWFYCGDYWEQVAYYAKYGFNSEENVLNSAAMLEDITAAIQVK